MNTYGFSPLLLTNLHSWHQPLFRGSLPQRDKVTPRIEDFYFPTIEKPHIANNSECRTKRRKQRWPISITETVFTVKIMKNILTDAFWCIFKYVCMLLIIYAKVDHTIQSIQQPTLCILISYISFPQQYIDLPYIHYLLKVTKIYSTNILTSEHSGYLNFLVSIFLCNLVIYIGWSQIVGRRIYILKLWYTAKIYSKKVITSIRGIRISTRKIKLLFKIMCYLKIITLSFQIFPYLCKRYSANIFYINSDSFFPEVFIFFIINNSSLWSLHILVP